MFVWTFMVLFFSRLGGRASSNSNVDEPGSNQRLCTAVRALAVISSLLHGGRRQRLNSRIASSSRKCRVLNASRVNERELTGKSLSDVHLCGRRRRVPHHPVPCMSTSVNDLLRCRCVVVKLAALLAGSELIWLTESHLRHYFYRMTQIETLVTVWTFFMLVMTVDSDSHF